MLSAVEAAEVGRKFWDFFCANRLDEVIELLADDLVRVGPREGIDTDIIRGKPAYATFLRDIKKSMPAHGGWTNSAGGSADGTRAFVHCVEVVAVDPHSKQTYEVQVSLVLDLNAQGKITRVDCFWKQPSVDLGWTNAENLTSEARTVDV